MSLEARREIARWVWGIGLFVLGATLAWGGRFPPPSTGVGYGFPPVRAGAAPEAGSELASFEE